MQEAGLKVKKSFVIHINNAYVRLGAIEPKKLLTTEDVTEEVDDLIEEVRGDIDEMYKIFKKKNEPDARILKQCHNPYDCMFIDYCWRDIPEHSIYNVYPSEKEINTLLDDNIVDLADMPAEMISKEKQKRYFDAYQADKVIIDKKGIEKELKKYQYPLYFLDYETNAQAVPMFDGYRPYQQVPFQYSLHVQKKPGGKLTHFEYLADKSEDPVPGLAKVLSEQIANKGSVISWFMGFETGRNTEMGEQCPEYADFFKNVNERMLDLMDFFANGLYIDKNFFGSASLKKVLPVIAPHLSYEELNIQEGMTASESWPVLIGSELSVGEKKELRDDMLKYCELDTFAMVEIFRILNEHVK